MDSQKSSPENKAICVSGNQWVGLLVGRGHLKADKGGKVELEENEQKLSTESQPHWSHRSEEIPDLKRRSI